MPEERKPRNPLESFIFAVTSVIEGPVVFVRENIVEPNQKKYPWYHQQFRRVPTIDQCYTDDIACQFEANQQFKRDRLVDNEIVSILRQRYEDCTLYENPDHSEKCKNILDDYNRAAENWFIKYGDLGAYADAKKAYMKQKHRLIWERRHGPVGSGINEN
ncbi:NADH dehydrogenase [ubiquinone] 1 beta subcomplex subunit 10 [Chrysoperla carnea]|uniref:NADH dehydrogenase [ubiquinone] 1 beta subcomplex subunit 10 n=1 Tax=Chrysoperla carnea TaxID=189513 RepID=UPI001D05EB5B|nr:NADH dehydrogenase [ubiquinone] 1 beta subcomplex subunit 10 [Chrysoperla carnea]